jgi:hypothetical protein
MGLGFLKIDENLGLDFNLVGEVCRIVEKLGFDFRWRREDGFVFQNK